MEREDGDMMWRSLVHSRQEDPPPRNGLTPDLMPNLSKQALFEG